MATRLALTLRGPDNQVRLYTRLLSQSQVTPLAGTEKARYPFFSPDGAWIGFGDDRKLKKVPVEGGAVVTLCDYSFGPGASWGDDGNIIAALAFTGRPVADTFRRRNANSGDEAEPRRMVPSQSARLAG